MKSVFNYTYEKNREQRKSRIKDWLLYSAVAVGAAALCYLGIKPEIDNRKYNTAPVIEYTIQKGDTIEKLMRAEGLDTNDKLSRGMNALKRANDFYVSWNTRALDNLNDIKEGQKIYWLDFNGDKRVGNHPEVCDDFLGIDIKLGKVDILDKN